MKRTNRCSMIHRPALVVLLLVFLAGCSGETDVGTPTKVADGAQVTSAPAESPSESSSRSTTSTKAVPRTTAATATTVRPSGGTFDNPVPGGEFAEVGDWRVRVIEVTPVADDLVMGENQFNDPPEEGNQFFMATLEAEYIGAESGSFWIDMTWKAVGPSAVAYEEFEASCGLIPGDIGDAGETFPGGVITGNVCWSVSGDDAADLVMLLDESFSFDNSQRTAYRLTDSG